MLPVVRGERETTRQILLYTLALVASRSLPLAWSMFGARLRARRRSCSAARSSGSRWRLRRETTPRRAAVLFHYSLAYLALLFVAMAVDPVLL